MLSQIVPLVLNFMMYVDSCHCQYLEESACYLNIVEEQLKIGRLKVIYEENWKSNSTLQKKKGWKYEYNNYISFVSNGIFFFFFGKWLIFWKTNSFSCVWLWPWKWVIKHFLLFGLCGKSLMFYIIPKNYMKKKISFTKKRPNKKTFSSFWAIWEPQLGKYTPNSESRQKKLSMKATSLSKRVI